MKKPVLLTKVIIMCLLIALGPGAYAQSPASEQDSMSRKLKKSLESYDSMVKALSDRYRGESVNSPQVKIGDSKDGGIVYWLDGTGKHGLIAYSKDLGIIKWEQAVEACRALGAGWRLPTKDELEKLYQANKDLQLLASYFLFQSATGADNDFVWKQSLSNGRQSSSGKDHPASTAAVRTF